MIDPAEIPAKFRMHGMTPLTVAQRQVYAGRSWGLLHPVTGVAIACGGLHPHDGRLEAWFVCGPHAADRLLEIVRWAQLTFSRLRQDGPIDIVAQVAAGHAPGQRLARLIGFELAAASAGFETWKLK